MLKQKLEKEELKKLDFNKSEYEYFIENRNFTERQLEIFNLRRKGKTIIEMSFITHLSERTINREIKRIKKCNTNVIKKLLTFDNFKYKIGVTNELLLVIFYINHCTKSKL